MCPRNPAWAVWAERFTHRSYGGKIWEDLPIQTVLANASLDIAFHDTYFFSSYIKYLYNQVKHPLIYFVLRQPKGGAFFLTILFFFICSLFSLYSVNIKENNLLNTCSATGRAQASININKFLNENSETDIKNYIEQFFVGLLEGDGTITVDFVRNNKKRVRIFIAIKNLEENRFMLNLIQKYIGGRVVIERNNRYVTWYATSRTDLAKVFAILAKYPLLSTRKLCQLDFAKDYIDSTHDISKQEFTKLRDDKYKNQEAMLDWNDKNFVIPKYFPAWLSGFIEAEGHFKIVKTANNSIRCSQFIIGQNYEKHLLKAILNYLNKENNKISFTLSKKGVTYYKIHLGGSDIRSFLDSHFNSYPLLGDKNTKYQEWVNKH